MLSLLGLTFLPTAFQIGYGLEKFQNPQSTLHLRRRALLFLGVGVDQVPWGADKISSCQVCKLSGNNVKLLSWCNNLNWPRRYLGRFYLFPCLVWNSNCLKGGAIISILDRMQNPLDEAQSFLPLGKLPIKSIDQNNQSSINSSL